ncbi:hypothetical protein QR680_017307 [Steinernema hermaphroditum]|uniref:UPAR/Ly6 domain-containing protein n=1 Tax=Steinernema hermaphroditum TaxID=289476 RepID=A0AA39HF93_9BILA|nr:hypothetical protein QR680_017307 [Steinernema hermaphroditum]
MWWPSSWVVLLVLALCEFSDGSSQLSRDVVTDYGNEVVCYECTGDKQMCRKTYKMCTGKACRRSHLFSGDSYKLECLNDIDEGIQMGTQVFDSHEILTCRTDRCNSAPSFANGVFQLPSVGVVAIALLAAVYGNL